MTTDDIEDFFASLAGDDNEDSPYTLPVKGLTVRLDSHVRAEISALCFMTDLTRQQLLEKLIVAGLDAATSAYLGNSSDETNANFYEHVYRFILDEGVDQQIVEQLTGFHIETHQ